MAQKPSRQKAKTKGKILSKLATSASRRFPSIGQTRLSSLASIAARISTRPIRGLVESALGGPGSPFYARRNPRTLEHSITKSASRK
jgi:hypothetical protein